MDHGTIQIDAAGRLTLPKFFRKKFNLSPGDKLRFSADENGILLEPVGSSGQLIRKGSALVFRGEFTEPVTNKMISRVIDSLRNRTTSRNLPD